MTAVWRESQSLGRARLVLLAIADHQGEIGAWPSIATLAKMVNASERSVQRDISELVELGELIKFEQQAPSRGQYKSNLYWVNLPSVSHLASGVTESASGVTENASGVTAGGVLTITRTIKEPLTKKPSKNETGTPTDFKITDEMIKWGADNVPRVDVYDQTPQFLDYHTAKGSKFKDWTAAWRTWMRKANEFKSSRNEIDPWAGKKRYGVGYED